jgi:alcohol dehydrogenase class IV
VRWEFGTANRILFGPGAAADLPGLAQATGKRPLVVTGADPARHASVLAAIDGPRFSVRGEPTVDAARSGAAAFRDSACDFVLALGGGSVLDAGKAIAILAPNSGEPLDYLEVVGQGKAFEKPAVPVVAVPTTAGTGAEVTRNAVLGSPEHHLKASLRHASMLPRLALVDPELTYSLPPAQTAATGLDALTQLIEPYVSHRANPLTDVLCLEGIRLVLRSLYKAYENGSDAEARRNMSQAALFGGMALANAGLGVVHGFAAPIGGMFTAAHGAVCAALLPHGMRTNVIALRSRAPRHASVERYRRVASELTGRADATAEEGIHVVAQLCEAVSVAPLRTYGLTEDHLEELCEKAASASSMKANPISLTPAELRQTLVAAL